MKPEPWVTVGLGHDAMVRVVTTTDGSPVPVITVCYTPDRARFLAREMLAAADRADELFAQIRIRDAGIKSEARL